MRPQVQTDLALDHAVAQHAQYRQQCSRRDPFGLLQPYGSNRRWGLDPATAGFHRRGLLLIGLENLGVRTHRSTHRGGQPRPPIVLLSLGQSLDLDHEALARLGRRRVGLGRTSPTGAARAAARCPDARAERVLSPGVRPAPAAALPPAFIVGTGGLGIGQAGEPLRLHLPPVVGPGLGFLRLRTGIRLGMLLGQLTGRHDDKAPLLLGAPPKPCHD
jgi:hypothetical protein